MLTLFTIWPFTEQTNKQTKLSIPSLDQQRNKYLEQPYPLKVRVVTFLHEVREKKKGFGGHSKELLFSNVKEGVFCEGGKDLKGVILLAAESNVLRHKT